MKSSAIGITSDGYEEGKMIIRKYWKIDLSGEKTPTQLLDTINDPIHKKKSLFRLYYNQISPLPQFVSLFLNSSYRFSYYLDLISILKFSFFVSGKFYLIGHQHDCGSA